MYHTIAMRTKGPIDMTNSAVTLKSEKLTLIIVSNILNKK